MGSIPSVRHKVATLRQIDGAMPRLNTMPAGCSFHPRCPQTFARCQTATPPLMPAGASHAACWLYDKTAAND